MKRIVHGHYADQNSTRSIVEISSDEFDVLKEAVSHAKGKYKIFIEMSSNELNEKLLGIREKSLSEFEISDDIISEARKILEKDFSILVILEAKLIMMALSKSSDKMEDLYPDELRVLVDAARHTCMDFTLIINSTREQLINEIRDINAGGKVISEESVKNGLDKITAEEYKEERHRQVKVLYGILGVINEPFDGAEYTDLSGNKFDANKNKFNPSVN